MKQRRSLILVVLSLMVALVGVAASSQSAEAIRLVSVVYVPHKGPVFTFEVKGNFSRSNRKGTVNVQGGGNHTLSCTQTGETTVKCHASQKVAAVNVSVTFGGATFWTYVPGMPESVGAEPAEDGYCYEIYDYDMEFVWRSYGPHCQKTPAEYNDVMTYHNPVWDDDYDVVFMPKGPFCSGITEDAYYYPLCEYWEPLN